MALNPPPDLAALSARYIIRHAALEGGGEGLPAKLLRGRRERGFPFRVLGQLGRPLFGQGLQSLPASLCFFIIFIFVIFIRILLLLVLLLLAKVTVVFVCLLIGLCLL